MPTIIDEFVARVGIDPKGAKSGAREAQQAFKDTENVARKSSAAIASAISSVISEFVGLFLVIRSVSDAVHFFGKLNGEIADLGYASKNLGESATELRTWQQVAQQFGGTAEGITKTIDSLQKSVFDLHFGKGLNEQLQTLQRLKVQFQDGVGNVRDYKDILEQTAEQIKKTNLPRAQQVQLLRTAGFDEGSINAILAGSKAIEQFYRAERATAAQTAAGVRAAQQLERSWLNLKNTLTGVAATVLNTVSPAIQTMFKGFGAWVQSHQKDIANGLSEVAKWAQGDGPGKIIDALTQIGDAAVRVAQFINSFIPGASSADAATSIKANDDNHRTGGVLPDARPGEGLGTRLLRSGNAGRDQDNFEKAHGLPTGALNGLSTGINSDPDAAAAFYTSARDEYLKSHKGGIFSNNAAEANRYARQQLVEQFGITDSRDHITALRDAKAGLLGYASSVNDPRASRQAGTTVNIGTLNVNAPKATDANGVAGAMQGAVQRKFNSSQVSSGVVQ